MNKIQPIFILASLLLFNTVVMAGGTPESPQQVPIFPENITQCTICLDSFDKRENLGCVDHPFCQQCLKRYASVEVNEHKRTVVKCPEKDCLVCLEMDPRIIDLEQVRKNCEEQDEELLQQSSKQRSYVSRELCKGTLGCLFCCCNCNGHYNPEGLEFCPNCRELIQHGGRCSAVYHKKCDRVFLRGNQCNIPCGCCVTGCYFPVSCSSCLVEGENENGRFVGGCTTCCLCWCVPI